MSLNQENYSNSEEDSVSSIGASSIAKLSNIGSLTDISISDAVVTVQHTNSHEVCDNKFVEVDNVCDSNISISKFNSNGVFNLDLVKMTLEENCSFLDDRGLINDLICYENKKGSKDNASLVKISGLGQSSEFCKMYQDSLTQAKEATSHGSINQIIHQQHTNGSYSSDLHRSETPVPVLPNISIKSTSPQKHVTFVPSISTEDQGRETLSLQMQKPMANEEPDDLFRQLDRLRIELESQEALCQTSDADMKSVCQLLLTHLSAQRRRNKELEDELEKSQLSLADVTEQVAYMKDVAESRAVQLKKAADQLGDLHKEWQATHKKLESDNTALKHKYNTLKHAAAKTQLEADTLQGEVVRLRQNSHDIDRFKKLLEEKDGALVASRTRTSEVVAENSSISTQLHEALVELRLFKNEKIPVLSTENLNLNKEINTVSGKLKETEDEVKVLNAKLKLLQRQHQLLLNCNVQEEKKKTEAQKYTEELKKKTYESDKKLDAVHKDLHFHYQNKIEKVVFERDQILKDKFHELETNIRTKFNLKEQSIQKEHTRHIDQLKKSFEVKMSEIEAGFQFQLNKLKEKSDNLQQENVSLKKQQESVVAAVSAILTPTATPISRERLLDIMPDLNSGSSNSNSNSSQRDTHREQLRTATDNAENNGLSVNTIGLKMSGSNSSSSSNNGNLETVRERTLSKTDLDFQFLSNNDPNTGNHNFNWPVIYQTSTNGQIQHALTGRLNRELCSSSSKKIYTALEIINGQDNSEDQVEPISGDFQERNVDEPTRDTSIDFDAASITLDKISSLHDLISQY